MMSLKKFLTTWRAQRGNFLNTKYKNYKIIKAKRVLLKKNCHFHKDRPHRSFPTKLLLKLLRQNAFSFKEIAIFIKIAPIAHFLQIIKAQRVLLKGNRHFLQDLPHLFFV